MLKHLILAATLLTPIAAFAQSRPAPSPGDFSSPYTVPHYTTGHLYSSCQSTISGGQLTGIPNCKGVSITPGTTYTLLNWGTPVTGCVLNSTTAVTGCASTNGWVQGFPISGNCIPSGDTIAAISSTSAITLAVAATCSVAGGESLTAGGGPGVLSYIQVAGAWADLVDFLNTTVSINADGLGYFSNYPVAYLGQVWSEAASAPATSGLTDTYLGNYIQQVTGAQEGYRINSAAPTTAATATDTGVYARFLSPFKQSLVVTVTLPSSAAGNFTDYSYVEFEAGTTAPWGRWQYLHSFSLAGSGGQLGNEYTLTCTTTNTSTAVTSCASNSTSGTGELANNTVTAGEYVIGPGIPLNDTVAGSVTSTGFALTTAAGSGAGTGTVQVGALPAFAPCTDTSVLSVTGRGAVWGIDPNVFAANGSGPNEIFPYIQLDGGPWNIPAGGEQGEDDGWNFQRHPSMQEDTGDFAVLNSNALGISSTTQPFWVGYKRFAHQTVAYNQSMNIHFSNDYGSSCVATTAQQADFGILYYSDR
jgi:hypothetical protein